MAEPDGPFLFDSNSGIRSGGSCKVRHEWVDANSNVPMVSSCPTGEDVFLKKLQDGTFVFDRDMYDDFRQKWNTVNPGYRAHSYLACKF